MTDQQRAMSKLQHQATLEAIYAGREFSYLPRECLHNFIANMAKGVVVTHYVYEDAAVAILEWLHKAETALVGKAVVTFNGEAGTVRDIRLDEHHGLCFTLGKHTEDMILGVYNWYPVSTIKHKEVPNAEVSEHVDGPDRGDA